MPIPIPSWFGARRKARIGNKVSYNVTALGKTKAEKCALEGPRFSVLSYLAEQGPAGIPEITKEASKDSEFSLTDEKVRAILRGLIGDGYVAPVAGE